jgi:exopolysaccharide biosynthesis polyprenyl glycosylphosphotransferase
MNLLPTARRWAAQLHDSPFESLVVDSSTATRRRRAGAESGSSPLPELPSGAGNGRGLARSLWIGSWSRVTDTLVALLVLVAIVVYSNRLSAVSDLADLLAVRVSLKNLLLVGVFIFAWPSALTVAGAYRDGNAETFANVVRHVAIGCALGSALSLLVLLTSNTGMLGAPTVPIFWIGSVAGTLLMRLAARSIAAAGRQRREPRRVVIAGTGARAAAVWEDLQLHPSIRYELIATADLPDAAVAGPLAQRPMIPLGELETFLMHTVVDEVVVALPVRSRYEEITRVLRICEHAGVHSLYLADAFSPTIARARVHQSGGFSVVSMEVVRNDWRVVVKRAVDVLLALVLLVLAAPLMLAIAVVVKLTSHGGVIFSQERYGFRKRRFRMFKFRTMVSDAEESQAALEDMNEMDGPIFKIANDPRLTPVGGFLRRTSLDELPQLWNVLRGDMSIVGPRPLPIRDVSRFEEAWLMRRFSVQPGLTGLWQVSGRSNVAFSEWVKFDLQYIDTWSLMLDIRILLRTIPVVFRGLGAM